MSKPLERLRAIAKRPFVVNAVHIAVDFICPDQEQAKLAALFFGACRGAKVASPHAFFTSGKEHPVLETTGRRATLLYTATENLKPAGTVLPMPRCDLPVQTPVGARVSI